jgi:hypothetical protein
VSDASKERNAETRAADERRTQAGTSIAGRSGLRDRAGVCLPTMRHKLVRDTKAWRDALPESGRARYERALQAMAISISQHAAHGSAPDVVARALCTR